MSQENKNQNVGIIVVAYGYDPGLTSLLRALAAQKLQGDKIVVVDNHADHQSAVKVRGLKGVDYVVEAENNGFSAGCNLGVETIQEDIAAYLFINPDTRPKKDFLKEMRKGMDTAYDAWMGMLVLPSGEVNSAGNVVHTSGLSWCGGYLADAASYKSNSKIHVLSGGCMMVRREVWQAVDGLCEEYFMYYEDTDLSSRLLLQGYKIGFLPAAKVEHDYEFIKGDYKWIYLERNRLLYILRTWPLGVLLVLLPQLIASEFALFLLSILQGRLALKLKSLAGYFKSLPWALRTRRTIQSKSKVTSYQFLKTVEPEIANPLLGGVLNSRVINFLFISYYKLALGITRLFSKAD